MGGDNAAAAAASAFSQHGREAQAAVNLEAFQPRWWHFLWGGSEKRREGLERAVQEARAEDDRAHQKAVSDYQAQHAEWKVDTELAKRLLAGDVSAQRDVIEEMQSLSDEGLIGTHLSFRISDEFLHAIAHVHSDEVVPKFRRKTAPERSAL